MIKAKGSEHDDGYRQYLHLQLLELMRVGYQPDAAWEALEASDGDINEAAIMLLRDGYLAEGAPGEK